MRRALALSTLATIGLAALALGWASLTSAQQDAAYTSPADARRALTEARRQGAAARGHV